MTKNILNITLSIFILSCALVLWLGLFSAKSTLEHYSVLADQTRQAQEEIIQTSKQVQDVLFEAGFATMVIALSENKVIPPTDAEKMITESVKKIKTHSDRLGQIATYVNDYRIEQQRK